MTNEEKVIGIAAEFHKDSGGRLKLFSLFVRTEEVSRHDGKTRFGADGYDVDWSKKYLSYVFHQSSCGFHEPEVSGIYFLAGDMKVKETPCSFISDRARERNKTRRLVRLPRAFDMDGFENLLEWLRGNAIESDTEYCSVCRDRIPTTDDQLCDHVWWCEKESQWSTPDQRCKCKNREECDDRE